MSDPLTVQVWPWVLIALALIAVLLWLADRYDNGRLPRARASLDAGLVEDAQVEWLESIPVLGEERNV